MKTVEEITNQEPVFLNDWSHKVEVIADFEDIYISLSDYLATECPYQNQQYWLEKKAAMDSAVEKWSGIKILFASYGRANYSGSAWVLFEEEGKLYEVNGSHCSCYGLEGQWKPEEILLPELENRLLKGTFGEDDWSDNSFKKELCGFLGVEFKLNNQ